MAKSPVSSTPQFDPWLEKRSGFEGLTRPAKLTDFEADKSLGKGAYGKVIKVKSREKNKFYAMKVVAKKTIENYNMKDQLKNEVNIMSKLSHPRIITLETIFEDQKNIYFVLELAEEGHLYSRIQAAGKFDEPTAAKVLADLRRPHLMFFLLWTTFTSRIRQLSTGT